jgi:hypothetical protein
MTIRLIGTIMMLGAFVWAYFVYGWQLPVILFLTVWGSRVEVVKGG